MELENNHKSLSHELRSAWKNVWPGSVDFVFDKNVSDCLLGTNPFHLPGDSNATFVTL